MLRYMVFMAVCSTANIFQGVPVKFSKKIKLVGLVRARNSVEACEKASQSHDVDVDLLSACQFDVWKGSFMIHRHDPEWLGLNPCTLGKVSNDVKDELDIPDDDNRVDFWNYV